MHKNATKCNKTLSKLCKNKHGASKIIDTLEMYLRLLYILMIIHIGKHELAKFWTDQWIGSQAITEIASARDSSAAALGN
jgi:hypothetical protein